jgi:hypothetical protein
MTLRLRSHEIAGHAQHKVAEGKAWADLDRLLCDKNRLFWRVGIRTADGQCIVRIGIPLIELDRLQGGVEGTVKANKYRPFSASNPAERVGNS